MPGYVREIEQVWKDGDTWRAGQDAEKRPARRFAATEAGMGVSAIDAAGVRAIMEDSTNGLTRQGYRQNAPISDLSPFFAFRKERRSSR